MLYLMSWTRGAPGSRGARGGEGGAGDRGGGGKRGLGYPLCTVALGGRGWGAVGSSIRRPRIITDKFVRGARICPFFATTLNEREALSRDLDTKYKKTSVLHPSLALQVALLRKI
jgi:hypothetical protein